jgi:Family of unknown function (DUF6228)
MDRPLGRSEKDRMISCNDKEVGQVARIVLASSVGSQALEIAKPDGLTETSLGTLTLDTGARVTAEVELGCPWRQSLRDLFEGMARDWRGWTGERSWAAENAGLELRCSHDGRAHVAMRVTLRRTYGRPTDWSVETTLVLDVGALGDLSTQVDALLMT